MLLNVPLKFEPTAVTAVMITTAMSAAMRPYSMAVAPDSSRRNCFVKRSILASKCLPQKGVAIATLVPESGSKASIRCSAKGKNFICLKDRDGQLFPRERGLTSNSPQSLCNLARRSKETLEQVL